MKTGAKLLTWASFSLVLLCGGVVPAQDRSATPPSTSATVYVFRPHPFLEGGGMTRPLIFVNDYLAATMERSTYVSVVVPPGPVVITAASPTRPAGFKVGPPEKPNDGESLRTRSAAQAELERVDQPTKPPDQVKLGQTIVIPASGIEISLTKVALAGGTYEGMRPYNRAAKPENDGVLAIVGRIVKGKPDVFWPTEKWVTDEKGQRNAKEDMAAMSEGGMSKGRGFTLFFNVPKTSRKLVLHLGDAVAIDLAPFLQARETAQRISTATIDQSPKASTTTTSTPPPDTTPARYGAAKLEYEGVYVSEIHGSGSSKYHGFLRFYPEGSVIQISSTGEPEALQKWFTKDNSLVSRGMVTIMGDQVSFSCASTRGLVDYAGKIDGDHLRLDTYSHINQTRTSQVFTFVRWNAELRTGEDISQTAKSALPQAETSAQKAPGNLVAGLHPVTETQGKSAHDLSLVLIDMDSKRPVSSARITLAPKKEKSQEDERIDEDECTIHSSLAGLSDERGEVNIQNVDPGEYVVIQILSENTRPELEGKVVTWGRTPSNPRFQLSLGPAFVTHGSLVILNGAMTISNGYMEADGLGIRTTATGRLLSVSVPSSGRAPIRIEIPNPAKSTPAK